MLAFRNSRASKMAMGSGAIRLSEVCTEFGRQINSQPRNLRSYLKCSAPPLFGFSFNSDYGVPEHENNNTIPSSGTLKLSNFRSVSTTVSQNYISNTCTADYVFNSEIFLGLTYFGRGFATEQALAGAFLPSFGGMSSIDFVGKSTARLSKTASIIGVFDYMVGTIFDPLSSYLVFAGDHRNSVSWDQRISSITVNIPGVGSTTKNVDASPFPDGLYDASYDATFYYWTDAFGFPASSSNPFTVEIELSI